MNFNLVRREPTIPFFRFGGDPFYREMEDMSDRLNRFFGTWTRPYEKEALKLAEWAPAVDIQETEKEYLVKAELPEVNKEDVKVTVEEGVLTLQGERKQEKTEDMGNFIRTERTFGSFSRVIPLDAKVAEDKIADYVRKNFDFRPKALIEELDLLRPIYRQTAAYGHFGRPEFSWERMSHADAMAQALLGEPARFADKPAKKASTTKLAASKPKAARVAKKK